MMERPAGLFHELSYSMIPMSSSEQYSSPYDMLLSLLNRQALPLTEVSLSAITEEYIAYLDSVDASPSEEIADFLTVAAKLLLLKSSLLLPTFQVIEEDATSLTEQLKLYERFRRASDMIALLWEDPRHLGVHEEIVTPVVAFSWPEQLTPALLSCTMSDLITANAPPKPLPKTYIDRTVSLKETIDRLRTIFRTTPKTSFWSHADPHNKTSIIIHFLALLELTKLGTVAPSQDTHFSDITLDARLV